MRKISALLVLVTFMISCIMPPQGFAQSLTALDLMPPPGTMVTLSENFVPAQFKAMTIDPNDPFKFDFTIYRGDEQLTSQQKQLQYAKLIKYFLAALAVPDTDQWVNLSPYETDRIIPDNFGLTEMGRDLLAQDYLLKQVASSLTNPDTALGKQFWDSVYAKAYDLFGTTDIPADTFNKVWVVPDKAEIYEKDNMVYVVSSHLKVMLDTDYLATRNNGGDDISAQQNEAAKISQDVMRQVIIPAIEQEVNAGRGFAPVRQVYSGMLLATWYKRALKESILGKVYADQSRVQGIDQDPARNRQIYDTYVEAFKKGVFNMIKEDTDQYTGEMIPRKYFSGGFKNFDDAELVPVGQPAALSDFSTIGGSSDQVQGILKSSDEEFSGEEFEASVITQEARLLEHEQKRHASLGPVHALGVKYRYIKGGLSGYSARVFKSVSQMDKGVQHGLVTLQRELFSKFESPYTLLGSIAYEPHGSDKGKLSNEERRKKGLFGFGDVDVVFGEKDFGIVQGILEGMAQRKQIDGVNIHVNDHFDNRTGRRIAFKLRCDKPVEGEAPGSGVWIDVEMFAQAQIGIAQDGQPIDVKKGEFNGVNNVAADSKNPTGIDVVVMKDLDGIAAPVCIGDARASIHLYVSNIANEVALYSMSYLDNTKLSPKAIERWFKLINLYQIVYPDSKERVIDRIIADLKNVTYDVLVSEGALRLQYVKEVFDSLASGGEGLVKHIAGLDENKGVFEGVEDMFQQEIVTNIFSKEVKTDLKQLQGIARRFDQEGDQIREGLNEEINVLKMKYEGYAGKVDSTNDNDLGLSLAVFNMLRFVDDMQAKVNGVKAMPLIVKQGADTFSSGQMEGAVVNAALPGMGFSYLFELPSKNSGESLAINADRDHADAGDMKGGIDFAQSNLDLQIKRDGAGFVLPLAQQDLDGIRIKGLVPVILNIEPAVALQLFK